jgi:hypothetical protein
MDDNLGFVMSTDRLNAEQEAVRSVLSLIELAERSRQLHERAGMTMPEPLRRILGIVDTPERSPQPRVTVPAPTSPPRPQEAQPGWIWINAEDASPTSVVLAILRGSKEPIRAKDVTAKVHAIQPKVITGSISNIGNRLDGDKIIQRTDEGWSLKERDKAPVFHDGYFWGAPGVFGKQELAAHRRDGILHLLHVSPGGLQAAQIVEQLRVCPWLHAPLNKELVQADIENLEREKKVRRRGNSRKWETVPEEKP